ncbi:LysR substrate-binding domain-containing protein [Arthrobacter sp. TE12232]
MNDPKMLLVPRNHSLARHDSVRIDALSEQEWIVRDEHPVADVPRRVCSEARFEPRIAFAARYGYRRSSGPVSLDWGPSHDSGGGSRIFFAVMIMIHPDR